MISDVLIQDGNQHLVREMLPVEKEIIAWLDTFLDCTYGKIQIAAICSNDRLLADEVLRGQWKVREGAVIAELSSQNETLPILARSICISVKDMRTINPQEVLHTFFTVVRDALMQIADTIQPENGNDAQVEIAQNGIKRACTQIEMILENLKLRLADLVYAIQISNLLDTGTKDGNGGESDGFPTIRILVFLPEEAFDIIAEYAKPEFYFFKQIRCVLLNEDRKIIDLRTDLKEQIREKEELEAENAVLREQNEEKDKIIAQLTEQDKEKDRIIIEKDKQIEDLKADRLRNKDNGDDLDKEARGRG